MDLLSFVVNAFGCVVSFAKVVALAVVAVCFGALLKRLPSRVRNIISALATAFVVVAIFRSAYMQTIAMMAFKAWFLWLIISKMSVMSLTFIVLLASFTILKSDCNQVNFRISPRRDKYREKLRFENSFLRKSFFLETSPVQLL